MSKQEKITLILTALAVTVIALCLYGLVAIQEQEYEQKPSTRAHILCTEIAWTSETCQRFQDIIAEARFLEINGDITRAQKFALAQQWDDAIEEVLSSTPTR